jgi:hypothetical protein
MRGGRRGKEGIHRQDPERDDRDVPSGHQEKARLAFSALRSCEAARSRGRKRARFCYTHLWQLRTGIERNEDLMALMVSSALPAQAKHNPFEGCSRSSCVATRTGHEATRTRIGSLQGRVRQDNMCPCILPLSIIVCSCSNLR